MAAVLKRFFSSYYFSDYQLSFFCFHLLTKIWFSHKFLSAEKPATRQTHKHTYTYMHEKERKRDRGFGCLSSRVPGSWCIFHRSSSVYAHNFPQARSPVRKQTVLLDCRARRGEKRPQRSSYYSYPLRVCGARVRETGAELINLYNIKEAARKPRGIEN